MDEECQTAQTTDHFEDLELKLNINVFVVIDHKDTIFIAHAVDEIVNLANDQGLSFIRDSTIFGSWKNDAIKHKYEQETSDQKTDITRYKTYHYIYNGNNDFAVYNCDPIQIPFKFAVNEKEKENYTISTEMIQIKIIMIKIKKKHIHVLSKTVNK